MWVRKIHVSGSRKWPEYSVFLPGEVLRGLKTPYLEVAEEGDALVLKPVDPEKVLAAAREVGPRALWTRGIYKVGVWMGSGGVSARVSLPRRVVGRWGARYVRVSLRDDGSVVVEPVGGEEEAELLKKMEAALSMTEVLKKWVERARGP
jgi:virulence-associated protein VagC